MAFTHGKSTKIFLDNNDLSAYTNTSELGIQVDAHDVTCYGATAHVFEPGLLNGTASLGGVYDNTASGPRAIIKALLGSRTLLKRWPDGQGSTKAQDLVYGVPTSYVETSPVADMVTWSLELQLSGAVTGTAQS